MDWERRGLEGDAPRKGRRAAAAAKSRWMTDPRCSGELRECRLGKVACGSGGSGIDEKGRGETAMGRRPTFVLKSGLVVRAEGEKGVGASAWAIISH
jgi:hypothetical protein